MFCALSLRRGIGAAKSRFLEARLARFFNRRAPPSPGEATDALEITTAHLLTLEPGNNVAFQLKSNHYGSPLFRASQLYWWDYAYKQPLPSSPSTSEDSGNIIVHIKESPVAKAGTLVTMEYSREDRAVLIRTLDRRIPLRRLPLPYLYLFDRMRGIVDCALVTGQITMDGTSTITLSCGYSNIPRRFSWRGTVLPTYRNLWKTR